MENQILVDLLKHLVKAKSIYPEENHLTRWLVDFFGKNGLRVKKQKVEKNRYNLLIERGTGKKSILLYSHLDTVGITSGWSTNPFRLTFKKGKAYGLGAWDMKGGMAANILTFLTCQPKNIKLKLAFCVDEENISKGTYELIKSNFMSDVDCVISTEPAFRYGLHGIVTGRIGRAVYNVQIKGMAKHYNLYEPGIDPRIIASEFIQSLKKLNLKKNGKKQFVFVRSSESKAIGMSIPERIDIQLDSAILPPLTHQEMLMKLRNLARKIVVGYKNYFSLKINFIKRDTPFLNSYVINKNNAYLLSLKKTVKKILGKNAMPYFRSSVADENIFGANGITVLGIGPEGGNAHSPNEWVSLDSIKKLNKILLNFLAKVDNNSLVIS